MSKRKTKKLRRLTRIEIWELITLKYPQLVYLPINWRNGNYFHSVTRDQLLNIFKAFKIYNLKRTGVKNLKKRFALDLIKQL